MKHTVYLCQVNNQFGNNVFLPYSVGLIQAYCQAIPGINDGFQFKEFIYLRDNPETISKALDNPKVLGISCYVWNWEFSKALARRVKADYPDCLVVMGGPHVPVGSDTFFSRHPFVDLLVHHEGEITFAEILLEYLREPPDYTRIGGLSVRIDGTRCFQTVKRERLADLAQLPSPYLSGVFDDLVMHAPYDFHASQETHRGCPYACTFCDWGSAVFTKVRAFDDERLEAEFEWFGKHKIELLYNCDANYGLLKRDMALTGKLVTTKQRFGFPKQFRASYAKNSNMKIFELAKMLNKAGMSKGVTLSFQSMDPHTLDVVKRTNIKITDFRELMRQYRKEGIPTYTELIMGLPGETYGSFADGIEELIAAGQHDSLNIYMCSVLPNSEMAGPEYMEKYGIKFLHMPIMLQHSTPQPDAITEYSDIIVETATLSLEDWKRTFLFSWAVQCFHCLALTQYIAVFLHTEFGLSYRAFYEELVEFAKRNPETSLADQYTLVSDTMSRALAGGSWDVILPKFGNITWPLEEATFLNIICEKPRFYGELRTFVNSLFAQRKKIQIEEDLLEDLVRYQSSMVIDPFTPACFSIELKYRLHQYFENVYLRDRIPLARRQSRLRVRGEIGFAGDLETYARQVVWYGRKGGRFRHSNVIDEWE